MRKSVIVEIKEAAVAIAVAFKEVGDVIVVMLFDFFKAVKDIIIHTYKVCKKILTFIKDVLIRAVKSLRLPVGYALIAPLYILKGMEKLGRRILK